MIDRTAEDIAQDKRIAALEERVDRLNVLVSALTDTANELDERTEPLEELANQLKKIQDFFASIGKK